MSNPNEQDFIARYLNPPPAAAGRRARASTPSTDDTDPRMSVVRLPSRDGQVGDRPDGPTGYPAPGEATARSEPDTPAVNGTAAGPPPAVPGPPPHASASPQPDPTVSPPPDYPSAAPRPGYPSTPAPGRHSAAGGGLSVGELRVQVRQAELVRPYKPVPETGWRKGLHRSTRINLGLGPAEREWNDLKRRLSTNLRGTYLVAVLQAKGGVSKTTATIGIGAALSRYRDDKVVAIDANPASGNLARRIDEPSTGTWRSLIADPNLNSYSDFRHYLGKDSSSGLEVLAGDPGDDVLNGEEVMEAWHRLSRQYPVGIVDCGNQMRDDIHEAVLNAANAVVVVSTTRLDGAQGAQDTLNWLYTHGYQHLATGAVMVISDVNKVTETKSVRNLHEQFERVVRSVHDIPYDPHLSEATAVDVHRLAAITRRRFIETAASVVDGFAAAADKDPGYRPPSPWPSADGGPQR